jgi:hypothetical protein
MFTRKIFTILFLLSFGMNMVHLSERPDDCHCGDECVHHYPDQIGKKNEPYHKQNTGTDCFPCNIERLQTFEFIQSSVEGFEADGYDTEGFVNIPADILYNKAKPEYLTSSQTQPTTRFIPIYLQHQSFLC